MAYVPTTFTAGETPPTSKWNQLGGNDSSFNDGTGIGQVIGPSHLTATAITAGYVQAIANQTSITSTTVVQVTSLSAAVTVPGGGRRLEIEAHLPNVALAAAGNIFVSIWDGAVGSGTQLQEDEITVAGATFVVSPTVKAYPAPAAGGKTYNVGIRVGSSTAAITSSATAPSSLIVKVI
ncbi:hypothetical protein [Nakamurella sp. PAMC28650]|uniref:hypothetical protein n=1 Tax=Nakamurella sp. PAMC28650 TaxID=2762325 RepID=UPI00164DE7F1|nr:hypothetical protein [Nakamurella sp. PAMC28650]QNK82604.1 hypothetical protein H7F38_07820 [Nakamurella sp. PAMC28650]